VRNGAATQAAQYRAAQTAARVRQARSAILPNISALGTDGTRTFNSVSLGFPSIPGLPPLFNPDGQTIGPLRNVDYRGRIMQPLFDPSALGWWRSAQLSAQASETEVAVAAEQAGTTAALAYIETLRAEEECSAISSDSALAADLVRIAQNQLRAGTGIELDVSRAQTQLASIRARSIASRSARDRAFVNLLRALNLPLSTTLTLSDSLSALTLGEPSVDESEAVSRALATRPDLRSMEQHVAAMRQSVAAIRAERLPKVRLVGDDGVNSNGYNHLLRTYTYAVELSLPIFDGSLRQGRLQEQMAQRGETEVLERDMHERIAAEVRIATLELTSAQQQVSAARDALHFAEQTVAQARNRFQGGIAGNYEVITASLALTSARTAMIDALTATQNARIGLARAQGVVTSIP
jgi:outer membrane protein TolC